LGAGVLLLAPGAAHAATTIHVPADYATIQLAVDAATDGDTVSVAAGTYTEQVQVSGKSITIDGTGPATILRLPASATTAYTSREGTDSVTPIVHVIDAPSPGVMISDVGISPTNLTGAVTGILTEDSTVIVDDVDASLGTACDDPCTAMRFENSVPLSPHTATLSYSTVSGATVNVRGQGLSAVLGGDTFTGENENTDFESLLEIREVDSWQVTGSAFSGVGGDAINAEDSATGLVSTSTFTGRGTGVRDDDGGSDPDSLTLSDNAFADRTSHALLAGHIDTVTITGNRVTARRGNSTTAFSVVMATTATVTGNSIFGGQPALALDSVTGATVRFNRFAQRFGFSWGTGLYLSGTTGTVDARDNFWGCNDGPTTDKGCSNIVNDASPLATVNATSWLVLGASASPLSIGGAGTSAITATLAKNNLGATPAGNTLPQQDISFTTTRGTLDDPVVTTSGLTAATTLHTASRTGNAVVRAVLDNAAPRADVTISAAGSDPTPGGAAVTVDTAGNDSLCTRFGSACATIQHAVDIAATGDVISIGAGLFTEQVATSKGVTLQGQGDSTILRLPASGLTSYDTRASPTYTRAPIIYVADVPLGTFALRDVKISAINLVDDATALLSQDAPVVVDHVTVNAPGCEDVNDCQAFRFENSQLQGHEVTLRDSSIDGATVWFRGYGLVARVEGSTFKTGGASPDFYGPLYFVRVRDWLVEDSAMPDASPDGVRADSSIAGEIRNSTFGTSGVYVNDSEGNAGDTLTIDGATFSDQTAPVVAQTALIDTVTATGNRWTRRGTATGLGLSVTDASTATVTGNSFSRSQPAVDLTHVATGTVRFNRFGAAYDFSYATGLSLSGTNGPVDATDNFWSCNDGPTMNAGCMNVANTSGGTVDTSRWLVLEASVSPASIPLNGSSAITGRLTRDNNGATPSGNTLVEQDIGFATTRGNLDDPRVRSTGLVSSTTMRGGSYAGTAHVRARLDNAVVANDVTIGAAGSDPDPVSAVVFVGTAGNDSTCARGGGPCATIQHAIDIAQAGDVVSIGAGTFSGQLDVEKALTIRGQGAGSTIVQLPLVTQSVTTRRSNHVVTPLIHVDNVLAGRVWLRDLRLGESGIQDEATALLVEDAPVLVDHVSFLGTGACDAHGSANCAAMRFEASQLRAQEDTIRDSTITRGWVKFDGFGITARVEGSALAGGGPGDDDDTLLFQYTDAWHVEDTAFTDAEYGDAVTAIDAGPGEFVDNTLDGALGGVYAANGLQSGSLLVDGTTMTDVGRVAETYLVDDVTVTDTSAVERPGRTDTAVNVQEASTVTVLRSTFQRFQQAISLLHVPSGTVKYNRFAPKDALSAYLGLTVGGTPATTIDARWNWWGCNSGPVNAPGCMYTTDTSFGTVDTSRWYVLGSTKSSGVAKTGVSSDITASLLKDNSGATISPNDLPEQDIAFTTNAGSLNHATRTTAGHTAQSTLSYAAPDAVATVHVRLDNADAPQTIQNDDTIPNTTIDSGPTGLTNDNTPTFTFSSDDPTATFTCRVFTTGSPSGTPASCASPYTVSPALADGNRTLEVTATDAAGNVDATPATRSFTVDATPPTVSITAPTQGTTSDTTPTASFTAGEPVTFTCRLTDDTVPASGLFASCTSGNDLGPLAEGRWRLEVQATDTAGNPSLVATRRFTVNADGVTLVTAGDATSDTFGCGEAANPCDTIQHGVDNAASGEVVSVGSGVYTGSVSVPKAVSIQGTGFPDLLGELTISAGNVSITGFGVFSTISPAITVTGSANTGISITGNSFSGTGVFAAVASGSLGSLTIQRNRIAGFSTSSAIVNNDSHNVVATNNWWGCNSGCDGTTGNVTTTPRAVFAITVPVSAIKPGKTDTLTASLDKNSSGGSISPAIPTALTFYGEAGGPLGTFSPSGQNLGLSSGAGVTTWTSNGTPGTAHLRATLDSQPLTSDVTVSASAPDGGASVVFPPNNFYETDDVFNAASVGSGDPQDARITLPFGVAGVAGVTEQPAPGPYPSGYRWMGTGFAITADPDVPATMMATFEVYLPGWPAGQIAVFRDGTRITATCTPQGVMSTAPCVNSITSVGGGVFRISVLTDHASFWTVGGPDPSVVMLSGPNVTTPQWTNDNTPTFTYKTQIGGVDIPDASVTYACDAAGITTTCGAGTYTASSAIADGSQTMQIQAQVGGIAGPITSTSFFVDTVNPTAVRTSQPPAVTNSTTANFTWTRNDAAPSSGLTATDTCTLDGGAPTACGPGSKTYTGLAEGNHTFTATVTDRAGNSGTTVSYTWMVDLTPPTTSLSGTLPGKDQDLGDTPNNQNSPSYATHSTSATFANISNDPPAGGPPPVASGINRVECSLDGAAFTVGCPPYSSLPHGAHNFRVRAVDNAGNVGTPDSWDWFVDRRAPDIVPVYPYANGRFSYYKDVRAAYSCDDHYGVPGFPSESGVLTCLGTVPVGTPFDHTTLGTPTNSTFLTYPFVINTSDKVGNSAAVPFSYRVFTFAGLVLDDNPKAYYRMDDPEGSDVLTDFSGNGNDGTYKNGTESGPIGVSGDGNTARVFTGADGYGYVNDMAAPQHGYTMAAFVQFDDSGDGMVMQHGRAGALFRRGNQLVFMNVAEAEEAAITVPGGIVPGCWYFVAGRFDRFHATVYAGTHDNASGPDCTPTTSDLEWFTPQTINTDLEPSGDGSSFYVGYGEEAPWLHGSLDEVAYFDSILSPTHIKELWLADPPPGVRHVAVHSAPSSNPAPAVTHKPKPDPKIAAKARAKAKVKTLTKRLAAAKAHLAHIKRHHATAKQLKKATRAIATLRKQLAAARRRA
jgi:hypothetical protein